MSRDAGDIRRLFESATDIFMPDLHDGMLTGRDIRKAPDSAAVINFTIGCPPITEPHVPTTRVEALPSIVLRGPFKGSPNLQSVAFYVGIGFITVREIGAARASYEITGIDGEGIEERLAFLMAARDLFFNDVQFEVQHS